MIGPIKPPTSPMDPTINPPINVLLMKSTLTNLIFFQTNFETKNEQVNAMLNDRIAWMNLGTYFSILIKIAPAIFELNAKTAIKQINIIKYFEYSFIR